MTGDDFSFLDPIKLDFDSADAESFIRSLRRQLRERLSEQGYHAKILRAVYVIRMSGSFVIAYKDGNSPVLYVGRGSARGRIISHIGKWIQHVDGFGNDTQVEISILIPRKRNLKDFYKYVEADLLTKFRENYGILPYFNARCEKASAGIITDYTPTQEKRIRELLSMGKSKGAWWALKPTEANPFVKRYRQGEVSN